MERKPCEFMKEGLDISRGTAKQTVYNYIKNSGKRAHEESVDIDTTLSAYLPHQVIAKSNEIITMKALCKR